MSDKLWCFTSLFIAVFWGWGAITTDRHDAAVILGIGAGWIACQALMFWLLHVHWIKRS